MINGRGDKPNRHDILTGSQPDGTAFPADKDMTCKNYTSSTQGSVMVGHTDRNGLRDDDASQVLELVASLARAATAAARRKTCSRPAATGCLYCFASN